MLMQFPKAFVSATLVVMSMACLEAACSTGSSRNRSPSKSLGTGTKTGSGTGTSTATSTATGTSTSTGTDQTTGNEITLTTADDVKVFATRSKASEGNAKVLLLFHMAESNRHEYAPLHAVFNDWGWDTLAIDQRSGATAYGADNETVAERGSSTGEDYLTAKPDLTAAIKWAADNGYNKIVLVGSSYSAALVVEMGTTSGVTAIAAFSPGEYLATNGEVRTAAQAVTIPFYATGAADEETDLDALLSGITGVTRFKNPNGIHGAPTLREDDNAAGFQAAQDDLKDFLTGL